MKERVSISEDELGSKTIGRGNWFSLFEIQTSSGRKEIIRRNDGNIKACKILPLFVKPKLATSLGLKGKTSFKRFRKALRRSEVLEKARVALVACDRPVTYFSGVELLQNWLFELPGGVVESGEKISSGGVREALEELGLDREQVVAYSVMTSPMPYDSGSHAEYVSLAVALCTGKINPISREGILPENCRMVRFGSLRDFARRSFRAGICVEGHVLSAAAQLAF